MLICPRSGAGSSRRASNSRSHTRPIYRPTSPPQVLRAPDLCLTWQCCVGCCVAVARGAVVRDHLGRRPRSGPGAARHDAQTVPEGTRAAAAGSQIQPARMPHTLYARLRHRLRRFLSLLLLLPASSPTVSHRSAAALRPVLLPEIRVLLPDQPVSAPSPWQWCLLTLFDNSWFRVTNPCHRPTYNAWEYISNVCQALCIGR